MFKVVVTDYTYENLDIERKILARPDIELKDYQYRDAAHVKEITADCDVLVTQYADINREVIENLAHCRMIIRYAIGVDNIDLAAASERGIPVVNVPDYGIDEVSTYAVTLLLCAARKIPQTIDMIRRAEWNYAITKPMYRTAGKTVGLIGFGRIPRAVAKKLSGFDMQILAYDPFVSEESAKELGVKLVSFEELVCQSDYISVHCPLTAQTHHIVNEDVLRAMKEDGVPDQHLPRRDRRHRSALSCLPRRRNCRRSHRCDRAGAASCRQSPANAEQSHYHAAYCLVHGRSDCNAQGKACAGNHPCV